MNSSSTQEAISVKNVSKTFAKSVFGGSLRALHDVSFNVPRGQIFGLLGPNGAGKTTLIKILLGIIRRSAGEARLLGLTAGDRRSRRRVGYLPEQLKLPRHQTARTALEYYGRLSGMSHRDIRQRRDGILKMVGLDGRDRESVRRFSKGMQQRLGLAQALLHQPEVLILDEPTDGLDPVGRSQVRTVLQKLRDEGQTVFINSHLLQEVELVCDRVAILDKGQLRFVGTIEELTPDKETAIELELLGKESDVLSALEGMSAEVLESSSPSVVRLTIPVVDSSQVDAIVDRLRSRQISIQKMNPKRVTLEDAFLSLITVQAEIL